MVDWKVEHGGGASTPEHEENGKVGGVKRMMGKADVTRVSLIPPIRASTFL